MAATSHSGSPPRHVLVTGATGFVGRHLCALLIARGFSVRAAVRALPSDLQGIECVEVGEIGPDTHWESALAGIDSVVHLAARVHVMRDSAADPLAEFRRVNTLGTERLARATAAAAVRRLVFLSSVKVNGETSARAIRESDPPGPEDPYGVSKWEAEEALRRVRAEGGPEFVVLRPPLVYGPGVKGNFLRLLRACNAGLPLPLGAARALRSLLYVGNLCDAIVTCLSHAAAADRTYLVSDGEDVTTAELVRRLGLALGRPARLLPAPAALMRLALTAAGRGEDAGRLFSPLQVDSGAIRSELGWTPPFSLDEGLGETARWYRKAK